MIEYKTTDYCVLCGESPDSGTHLFKHTYVPPVHTDDNGCKCRVCVMPYWWRSNNGYE